MRGHEHVFKLRMSGYAPDSVWIDTDEDHLKAWADWPLMHNARAAVQLEPSDKRPDMRYVVGLPCYVQGSDRRAVFAARDACIEAKASRVIAMVMEKYGRGEFTAFRVVEITDTAGQQSIAPRTTEAQLNG